MKTMNFIIQNLVWILLILVGLVLTGYAVSRLQKPVAEMPTTKSVDFLTDSVVATPVMGNNPHYNLFKEAAVAAVGNEKTNPWVFLKKNWNKPDSFNGEVDLALIDFITKEAHRTIPDSTNNVKLSVRDYSKPNSVVMEYRDPGMDSVLITTGHISSPELFATFVNKKGEQKTFMLICSNGLVRDLGGDIELYNQDHLILKGETFIGITGSTSRQALSFAEQNNLPVRFVVEGEVLSKTPNFSKVKIFKDFCDKKKGVFDVIIEPGNVLRKNDDGKWIYVRSKK
jgi:hypothetical protein